MELGARERERTALTEADILHQERLSTLGRLMAAVVHDINSPMTAVLGQAQLFLLEPGLSPKGRERLELIIQETSRAAQMLRNVLLFARHGPPQRRPCDFAVPVRRTLELTQHQLRDSGVQIVTEFQSCPRVWCDESQIQQVLLNLVQNAHQAMSIAATVKRVLTVRVAPANGAAVAEVLDTGPGIPRDVLPRLFDPFFTTKPDGTGLGLWVSQLIVEQHGGRLVATNRPEGGAAFTVTLPYRKSRADEEESR